MEVYYLNLSPVVRSGYYTAVNDLDFIAELTSADPDAKRIIADPDDKQRLLIYTIYMGWTLAKKGQEAYSILTLS